MSNIFEAVEKMIDVDLEGYLECDGEEAVTEYFDLTEDN